MSKSLGNVTAPQEVIGQLRRRHPAALGDEHRRHRGPAHRPGDPEAAGGALPPHPQHAALAARRPRRLLGRRARAACRAAGAGALGAAPAGGAGRAACAAPSRSTTGPAWCRSCTASATPTSRPSTSTSARTRSTATPRTARGAAPRARCWTCCTATSAPGSRRCWCSPRRRRGWRASRRGGEHPPARLPGRAGGMARRRAGARNGRACGKRAAPPRGSWRRPGAPATIGSSLQAEDRPSPPTTPTASCSRRRPGKRC